MKSKWQQQGERSNRLGVSIVVWVARNLGRWPLRILLYPVVLYFFATAADGRAASAKFLRRVNGREPNWQQVFQHLYTFALVASDRLFLLSDKLDRYDITVSGEQVFRDIMAQGRGGLLLVSHLGSFEALRVIGAKSQSLPLRILLDRRQNPLVGDVIDSLDPELAAGIIDAGQAPAELALALEACLKRGELVGIMADRAAAGEACTGVEFFGDTAQLPLGPWQLAWVLQVPVILCFGLYLGGNRYQVSFELMTEQLGRGSSRRQRQAVIAQAVQHYAGRLQHHATLAPYNWFNFYDFWADETTGDN